MKAQFYCMKCAVSEILSFIMWDVPESWDTHTKKCLKKNKTTTKNSKGRKPKSYYVIISSFWQKMEANEHTTKRQWGRGCFYWRLNLLVNISVSQPKSWNELKYVNTVCGLLCGCFTSWGTGGNLLKNQIVATKMLTRLFLFILLILFVVVGYRILTN